MQTNVICVLCLCACCILFCKFYCFISWYPPVYLTQVEDLKAKLAVQEVELWQRNTDIEALLAKIGQQTDKLNQERAVADAEERKARLYVYAAVKQM